MRTERNWLFRLVQVLIGPIHYDGVSDIRPANRSCHHGFHRSYFDSPPRAGYRNFSRCLSREEKARIDDVCFAGVLVIDRFAYLAGWSWILLAHSSFDAVETGRDSSYRVVCFEETMAMSTF